MPVKSLIESAEQDRERARDKLHISKLFPDATEVLFDGEDVFVSDSVNTENFQEMDFALHPVSGLDRANVSVRLYTYAKKRPGKEAIKVYSRKVYGLTTQHLLNVAKQLPKKELETHLGRVLKLQESKK